MARRSGLGRGLGALIPTEVRRVQAGSALRELPVESIAPNPYQPRDHFDEEALASLTASIAELGVLQPILVRDGRRRALRADRGRAALAGRQAGRAAVDPRASCGRSTTSLSLEQALVENLHREDLNPLEEAAAYQQLIEDFDLTQEQVAQKVGKSRSAVANTRGRVDCPFSSGLEKAIVMAQTFAADPLCDGPARLIRHFELHWSAGLALDNHHSAFHAAGRDVDSQAARSHPRSLLSSARWKSARSRAWRATCRRTRMPQRGPALVRVWRRSACAARSERTVCRA